MKTLVSLSIAATIAVSANADLIKDAKDAGLVAIPSSITAQMELVDNKENPMTEAKIELGKKLYFDPRLSKSSLISCNTCHNLALGGTDGVSAAIGHKWTANPHHLNSPTVYNAMLASSQFWDGRDPHVEAQAQGPIQAGPEMAAPKELVEERINSIPAYVSEFKAAYGEMDKVSFKMVADTIATFERTLITPSRFDAFLEGDKNALNKDEKEGLKTFIDKGCVTCHNGVAIGGTMQPFQVANKYKFADVGDFKGDANGMVKTPTLRNIEETAPYFHNGKIWTLNEAVKEMGSTQLGIKINDKEAEKISTFLRSLTGTKPEITYPQLPASTPNTPKPSAN
ncbi:MAG: cytochrome-c peroxidase [Campylobacterales bacterium]|nr:cytochrome-c peroxidase [Campylobacterales bacterium]